MSGENHIATYRQILIWPLTVDHPDLAPSAGAGCVQPIADLVEREAKRIVGLDGPWRRVTDKARYLSTSTVTISETEKAHVYAEHVYFHRFIQKFLFKNEDDITLFFRDDIESVRVDLTFENHEQRREYRSHKLKVDRLLLYLFSAGTAALALEVSNESTPIPLPDAQRLANRLRRAYPAYFDKSGTPGEYPHSVSWYSKDDHPVALEPDEWSKIVKSFGNREQRHMPLASHWRHLLPFRIKRHGAESDSSQGEAWHHIVDDRMPGMLFLTLPDPTTVSDGDWMRLCFCDEPGDPKVYPYAEGFLRKTWDDHVYDRYWGNGMSTRYLCSGYHFAVVCQEGHWFTPILEQHFRRHYFQFGLILHFQHATLLAQSGNISQAVAICKGKGKRFLAAIEAIQRDLLLFTHRFWFTGVSNQIQARELYDWWRNRLGLAEIYEEVTAEAASAYAFLNSQRQGKLADAQQRQTEAASRLNLFVGIIAPLALAVGILSMNVVTDTDKTWRLREDLALASLVFAVAFAISNRAVALTASPAEKSTKFERHIGWVCGALAAAGFVAAGVLHFWERIVTWSS